MASGRSNKLVGQTGEYLVAAELSRRGLIATTFTGNVPHYDIIASDESGRHVSVQVKAIRKGAWQFSNVTQFFDITFDENRQIIGSKKPCPVQRLVMVFVEIGDYGTDRFYICTWKQLQNVLLKHHRKALKRHNGVRPRNPQSLHSAVKAEDLQPYADRWEIVRNNLK